MTTEQPDELPETIPLSRIVSVQPADDEAGRIPLDRIVSIEPADEDPAVPIPAERIRSVQDTPEWLLSQSTKSIADSDLDPASYLAENPEFEQNADLVKHLADAYRQKKRTISGTLKGAWEIAKDAAANSPRIAGNIAKAAITADPMGTRILRDPAGYAKNLLEIEASATENVADMARLATEGAQGLTDLAYEKAPGLVKGAVKIAEKVTLPGQKLALRALSDATGIDPSKPADSDDWVKRLLFSADMARKQGAAGTPPEGFFTSLMGVTPESLAKQGIVLDPTAVEDLSWVSDPMALLPAGKAFKIVSGTGRTLANAATKGAAEAFITKVGTAMKRGTGAALEKTGAAVTKAGEGLSTGGGRAAAAVTGALLGDASGAVGGMIAPGAVKKTGEALTKAGQIVGGKAPLPAPARVASKILGSDLVRGVTSAVNPLDNPELAAMTLAGRTDQEGAGVLGTGMAGVTFGAGVGLGKKGAVKGAQAIVDARFAQMDAPSVPTSDYGINPDLDAAHNQASNVLRRVDPKSAARMDYLRSTLPQGARLYVLPAARFSQEVAAALGSPEGTKFTDPGFYRRNPDGTSDLFLNSNTVALGHEVGHAVQHLMPAEDRGALTDAIRAAYTPEQIAAFGQHYDSLLSAAQSKHRISARPDLIVEEMGAEILSKVLLAQKVRGVPPTIAKQVVDFTSRLAEDLGLYKPDVGVSKAEGGTDLGVRPSVAVAEKAETILGKLADTTEASRPPVIPGGNSPQGATSGATGAANSSQGPTSGATPPPSGPPPGGTPPGAPPTPPSGGASSGTPPAAPPTTPPAAPPAAPAVSINPRPRNLRVTPDDQAAADARRKISGADEAERAIAANPGVYTAETAEIFRSINDAMQRPQGEVAPVRLDYRSVNAAPGSGTNAKQRAKEQQAAYVAETMGALPAAVRALADKMTVPYRWEVRGNNVNLRAFSVDKVLANARKAAEKLAGTSVTIPYDVRNGRFSDLAWQQMVDDLAVYSKNLANGFTGEGGRIVQPPGYEGVIPGENPNYQPTVLDSAKADFLNAMLGVSPPQTSKTPGGFQGKLVEKFPNVQAASVAEASGRPVIRPAAVARPGKETYTQGGASVPIAETNPFRQAAAVAGVDLSGRNLFQATEELNLQDIQAATAEPQSGFRAVPTDAARAGFMPDTSGRPAANDAVREIAENYSRAAGIDKEPFRGYVAVDEAKAKRLADLLQAAKHDPADPAVAAAYRDLADETKAQWDAIEAAGYKLLPWTESGQPYATSNEMVADVADNKRLYFFMTDQGYGSDPDSVPDAQPLLQDSGVVVDGKKLVYNDLFRAVHDFFGHAKEGYAFGPRGELNAYLAHSRMFTDNAVRALASETLAQNSWVNFGKHLQNEDGSLPKPGDANYVKPQDRPFADQKSFLLPDSVIAASTPGFSVRSGFMPEATNPRKARKLDVRARQMFGQPYGNLFQSQRNDVEASVAKDEAKTPKGHTDAITTSDGFKQWFGDWEDPNAFSSKSTKGPVSVVVGGDGAPLRVFHSTRGDFNQFESRRKTYDNFGILGNVETFRNAVFFSDSVAQAEDYSTEGDSGKFYPKSRTVPAYLNIKSPIDFTNSGLDYEGLAEELGVSYGYLRNRTNVWELFDGVDGEFLVEAAKKAGYDGAIFNEDRINRSADDVGRTFAVFDPGQIKSAIANKGTFDPKNPDIRFMPTMAEYEARKAARDSKPVIRAATKTAGGIQLRPKEPLPNSVGTPQRLIRYSSQAGEEIADPANFGRGAATARDRRGANKTFWFNEGSRTGADAAVVATAGKTAYGVSVDGGAIYDALGDDPLNWEGDVNRVKADERVREAGYTGVRTKSADGRSVTVLFEPVKQTELGRLIRPAKRAVNPGSVQFMPSAERDAAYLKAAEAGDLKTAQKMVDEAAKAAGYNVGPVYHGHTGDRFVAFDKSKLGGRTGAHTAVLGFFFTPNRSVAQQFEGFGDGARVPGIFHIASKNPVVFKSTFRRMDGELVRDRYGNLEASKDAFDHFWGMVSKMLGKPKKDISSAEVSELRSVWERIGHDSIQFVDTNMDSGARPDTQTVVFDPNNIKSADPVVRDDSGEIVPLSKRFDSSSSDIRFMPSTDEVREKMKTSALNVLHGKSPLNPSEGEERTNAAVATVLRDAAQKQWGRVITSDDMTPEEREVILQNMLAEVRTALSASGKNAGNWYTTDVEAAMEVAGILHPELNSDDLARATGHFPDAKSARLGLVMAMAITSQNLNVSANTRYADQQFTILKTTGRFDPSKEYGTKAESISGNLDLANALIEQLGWEKADAFLSQEFTVPELSKIVSGIRGKKTKISGRADDLVRGSALFGPKIGQGFFQNLIKNFTPVTIDLWMRRTWGRWTGDVVGDGATPTRLARLLAEARANKMKVPEALRTTRVVLRPVESSKTGKTFRTVSSDVADRLEEDLDFRSEVNKFAKDTDTTWNKLYKGIHNFPVSDTKAELFRAGEMDLETLAEHQAGVLERLNTQYENLHVRPKVKADWVAKKLADLGHTTKLGNKEISNAKPEWASAARNIVTQLNPVDAPNDQDREIISGLVNEVRRQLKAEGLTTTNADIQAILWYPEKDIWRKLRGKTKKKTKSENPDDESDENVLNTSYNDEFIKLAKSRGLGDAAKAAADRVYARAGTARSGGEPDAGGSAGVDPATGGADPTKALTPSSTQPMVADVMNDQFAQNVADVASGSKFGITLNSDGSEFATPDAPSDVVTLASVNVPESSLTPDVVRAILASWGSVLQNPSVKPGLFRLENQSGPQMVSVDLNVVVPQTHRENTAAFARDNQQESFFDLAKFEVVPSGGSGQTVLTKPAQWVSAAADLAAGKPVDVAKLSQP